MTALINASTSSGVVVTSDTSGSLAIQNNGTTAMTVTGGSVGIGTTSPASTLDVKAGSGSVISRSTSGVNYKAFYDDGRTTYTSVNYDGISTSGAQDLYVASGQNIYFRTNTNSSVVNAGLFDTSGFLLMGNTSFASADLNAILIGPSLGRIVYQHLTGTSSGSAYDTFQYAGNSIGSITQNGTTAVAYNTSSDYRLKENIAPMTGALQTVSLLKPVTYKWKTNGEDGQGFIAHELAEVVPEAVTGEKDAVDEEGKPVYQGIDTSFLVATLTAAIQELKAELDATKAEVAALKGTL